MQLQTNGWVTYFTKHSLESCVNVTLNLICCHQFLQYLCALGNILKGENKVVNKMRLENAVGSNLRLQDTNKEWHANGTGTASHLPLETNRQVGRTPKCLRPCHHQKLAEGSHGHNRPSETPCSPEAGSSPSLPHSPPPHPSPSSQRPCPCPSASHRFPRAHIRWASPSFHVQLSCPSPGGSSPQGDLALHSAGTQWCSSAST